VLLVIGRRGGGVHLLANHPWLLVLVLVVIVALVIYAQRRR